GESPPATLRGRPAPLNAAVAAHGVARDGAAARGRGGDLHRLAAGGGLRDSPPQQSRGGGRRRGDADYAAGSSLNSTRGRSGNVVQQGRGAGHSQSAPASQSRGPDRLGSPHPGGSFAHEKSRKGYLAEPHRLGGLSLDGEAGRLEINRPGTLVDPSELSQCRPSGGSQPGREGSVRKKDVRVPLRGERPHVAVDNISKKS